MKWHLKSKKGFSPQRKQDEYSTSEMKLSDCGQERERLKSPELLVLTPTEDTTLKNSSGIEKIEIIPLPVWNSLQNQSDVESSMQEFQLEDKKKTSTDKLITSEKDTLITNLLQILHQGSTSRERDLRPFWTTQSSMNSKKLWLPTKTDSVDSDLTTLNTCINNSRMLKSWFSTTVKLPPIKNSQRTFSQSLPSSQLRSMEEKSMGKKELKKGLEKGLKTLKCRIFPSKRQTRTLNRLFGTARWVYNESLWLLRLLTNSPLYKDLNYTKFKVNNIGIREFIRKVQVSEEVVVDENNVYQLVDYLYDSERREFPLPPGESFPSKAYRGVINNLVENINSCISNKGRIDSLRLRTKKDNSEFLPFDQWCGKEIVPGEIGVLKGHYKVGRRKIKLDKLKTKLDQKSFSIHYEKDTNRYFLVCPVTHECFNKLKLDVKPEKTSETQISFQKRDIGVLDPGVRTFQTVFGMDHLVNIGEGDITKIHSLLLETDSPRISSRRKVKIRQRIKHLVDELHWKTINYLTQNYNTIMLPEFPISQMVKRKNISKQTKRLMYVYRFYQFKIRLKSKCVEHGCSLLIVDESFTSKTCGSCGCLNSNLGGSKSFLCPECGIEIDRDANGARNILIKNLFS